MNSKVSRVTVDYYLLFSISFMQLLSSLIHSLKIIDFFMILKSKVIERKKKVTLVKT